MASDNRVTRDSRTNSTSCEGRGVDLGGPLPTRGGTARRCSWPRGFARPPKLAKEGFNRWRHGLTWNDAIHPVTKWPVGAFNPREVRQCHGPCAAIPYRGRARFTVQIASDRRMRAEEQPNSKYVHGRLVRWGTVWWSTVRRNSRLS
jgi:hypothetical protein